MLVLLLFGHYVDLMTLLVQLERPITFDQQLVALKRVVLTRG